ncbi:MAG: hypothetical protein EOO50_02270 [Flavobacterium sp.]|uniref:hypothetical protein n=1 Tax=Flavobacterium sp. TaxID=239 RepID=UPI0011FEAA1B|nr:hypothetical protein [Flavobacterium sp.]RZJ68265.1 MAG: hypothetical protein EOO50_02270 [Flavobacterium sp.]
MKIIRDIFLIVLSATSLSGYSCTIFSCAINGEVFAAANEDDYTPFTRVWFNPATKERFGSVCFGAPDLQVAAAINEFGLFYDYTAQYGVDTSEMKFKNPFSGDLFFEIIGKCKTVDEALKLLETHDYINSSQVLLADATGKSIVINPGGKVLKQDNYQINTNFNILDLEKGFNCFRYTTAENMLSNAKTVSVPMMKSVLNATHQEGNLSTQYSAIYDLKRKKVYVYLFHDFENVFEIDLETELANGYRLESLATRFAPTFAYSSYVQNHELYQKESWLAEIDKIGFERAKEHYLSIARNPLDAKQKTQILDVAIQLMRDANNKQSGGKVWEYWFGFQNGFNLKAYADERLDVAESIFEELSESESDIKIKNFEYEMIAYLHLLRGDKKNALVYYSKAGSDAANSYPISYDRSLEMLKKLK